MYLKPHKILACFILLVNFIGRIYRFLAEVALIIALTQQSDGVVSYLAQLEHQWRVFVVLVFDDSLEWLSQTHCHHSRLFQGEFEVDCFLWS